MNNKTKNTQKPHLMRYLFSFWLILGFTSMLIHHNLQAQCNGVSESDSLELVNFYEALDGDNWINNEGWLVEPVKDWFGVTLSEDACSIEKLELGQNKLNGNIFDFNLPSVQIVNLRANNLSGEIPNFSNIVNIRNLDLSRNSIIGSIPDFNNLPNLKLLNLEQNQLSGTIPDFSELPILQSLNLQFNPLISLPNFSHLPNLQYLHLNDSELNGTIPNFSNLPNLLLLELGGNNLTGQIPDFTFMENLEVLNIQFNQLIGTIPNFNLSKLKNLDISSNNFLGSIPNFISCPKLEEIDLAHNNLTGTIPNFNLPNLKNLWLGFNELSGSIPNLGSCPNLENIRFLENQLSGTIPDFSNLVNLISLSLNNNQLSGTIPDFSNLPNLTKLFLDSNQLIGSIPDFSNLPNLIELFLSNNQLTGSIPDFSNLPRLQYLYLQSNQLSGYIPNFSNLPELEYIQICPNNLWGLFPNFENSPFVNLVLLDKSCIPSATITGSTFNDLNQNCIQDEGEQALPNTKITVNDSLYYTYTDENGFYKLQLDTGTYQITATPPNFLWSESCPQSYTIILENYNDSIPNQNFGFEVEDECTFLTIDVASPLQRRCFTNTYTISYCNEGTKSADSAYVELTFPPEIIPLNASIPFEQNGNVWSFDLDTLAIGECGFFTVTDSVSCDAVLGSAACVEGRIYPAFLCRDISTLWDGSDIEVTGECIDNEFIEFVITNIGEDMQDSIEYRIYEDDILSSLDKLQLMSGESESLQIAATGATYRLKAEQSEFHPFESIPQVVVELCGNEPYSLGFVTSQPNSDLEHFIDIDCQEIIGSFDPNDKAVHPTGIADQHYIAEGTELTYKIRFQNTGNDTAFRVAIIDTLHSDYLDLQTFEITSASHPYNARIANQNVLIVEFNNILLPDSTTNELESHGFVQYRITPFQDAPKNSIVTNVGDIYFDYNQPITTNTVFNTIGIPLLDVTLPIELLQFNAYLDDHQNAQLTWITASEINNSHFEVQRSSDGRHFAAIGKIEGKGTTSELHSYQFEDSNLPTTTSTVYYRLKQIDFNGQYSYSKVVSLQLENERTTKIWYNAAQNKIEVIATHNLQLQVFDATGRLVKSVGVIEGKQTIEVNDLASGVYAYQLLQQNGILKVRQQGKLLVVGN